MKATIAVLAVALYAAVYAVSAFWLNEQGAFPLEEALMIFAIIGVGFSFLSWVTTIGLKPNVPAIARPGAETVVMLLLAAGIAAWLVWGKSYADNIIPDAAHGGSDFGHVANVLIAKLSVFVAIPFLIFRALFKHGLADFGLGRDAWRRLLGREGLAALGIAIAICAFQYFAGRGAAPIRDGTISGEALWIGLPLAFLWLMLLVGLVEEFFFRGVMQTRLAALFRSEVAGLVVMAILFGLMHTPGMVLRGAGEVEGLSMNPDWATAAAYTIVVQSVAAFYLGIFWMRTRNLPAVMIVHAATDLLPNLSDFVKPFGLAH
jgi:membrane protease YdiL (CAAX protease family)